MERMKKRLFSVMERHDELPEMSLPLTLLMFFGCVLFSVAAGKLATPEAPYGRTLTSSDYVGVAVSVLLLPIVGCMYASIILLWRKALSLLAAPICFGVMLWADVRLFPATAISLSMLLCAYVYATSLISGESRFRRMASLASACGICMVLTAVAYVGLYFGTFGQFTDWYMEALPQRFAQVYRDADMAVPEVDLIRGCRQLLMMVPSYTVVLSIALTWMTEFLMNTLFRVLECEDIFLEISGKITMPMSYAVVYGISFLLTCMTPADGYPFLHMLLNSVTSAMILPCAAIGLDGLKRALEEKLYYMTGEKLLTLLILALAFGILGLSGFIVVSSVCGTYYVIRSKFNREES